MSLPDDALSQAGHLLYRELPEEYRYRDQSPVADEPGDLSLYLHGFGHMLDLVRATTEQAYADGFAEATDTGHDIQPWLLPYLAELVGADLLAPDPTQRREELNNSVYWTKSKGTLRNIDHVSDVISGTENVVQEGWRHTLTCPRPNLPPFSVPRQQDSETLGHTPMPLGCPDFRAFDRAVLDPTGSHPLFRLIFPGQDPEVVYWQPRARGGVPAFPGSFCDGSARCPDLRDPEMTSRPGPHPSRALIHVRQPDGMFDPRIPVWPVAQNGKLALATEPTLDPAYAHRVLQQQNLPQPEIVHLELRRDLVVPAGKTVTIRNVRFVGKDDHQSRLILRKGARVVLENCAVERLSIQGPGGGFDASLPSVEAKNCLFGSVTGVNHFARMEYCTVTGLTDLERLHASDCLFGEMSSNLNCENESSCIRYSRFTPFKGAKGCFSKDAPTNTHVPARFVRRYQKDEDGDCHLMVPAYGQPGYAVLDMHNDPALSEGAEDDGELGAHHQHYTCAQLRALRKKLSAYLPLGQEIALAYDPLLSLRPPTVS